MGRISISMGSDPVLMHTSITNHMRATRILLIAAGLLCITATCLALFVLTPSTQANRTEARNPDLAQYAQSADIPEQITTQAQQEMAQVGEEYPPGATPPTVADLLPWAVGAEVDSVSTDHIQYTSGADNPVAMRQAQQTDPSADAPVTVVTAEGDVAVLAALDWECAWIKEFVNATNSGNADRVNTAVTQISKFPDLDVIQRFNPEVGEGHARDVIPRIQQGDVEFANYWLATTCSEPE